MPRPQLEDSFFDDDPAPKPAKKKAVIKPRKPKSAAPITESSQVTPNQEVKKPVFIPRPEQRDWDMEEAIKHLDMNDMIHPEDREQFAYILDPFYNNSELKARVDDWRQRNGTL